MFSGKGFIKLLLFGIPALLYATVTALARAFSGAPKKLSKPVISVGSPTVGGAGKTPCVIEIAGELINRGIKVGIVGSGYRRTSTNLLVASGRDIQELPVAKVGDEIAMMAQKLPEVIFAVDQSKLRAAEALAKRVGVDCIIIDDGLQTKSIHRDCDIVLLSANTKLTDLYLLPLGKLRLPMSSLKRANWLIVTKLQERESIPVDLQRIIDGSSNLSSGNRLLRSFEQLTIVADSIEVDPAELRGKGLAFAGLADNDAFFQSCRALGIEISETAAFPDHHTYTSSDIGHLQDTATKAGAEFLLTTEKDWVKVSEFEGVLPVRVVRLSCKVEQATGLIDELTRVIGGPE